MLRAMFQEFRCTPPNCRNRSPSRRTRLSRRTVAATLAMFSAVANLAFLAAYPLWSVIMIAVDILVIYAVLVYGDKRTLRSP